MFVKLMALLVYLLCMLSHSPNKYKVRILFKKIVESFIFVHILAFLMQKQITQAS